MKPIKLLQPAHQSVTRPFQEHPWPAQDLAKTSQFPFDRSQPRPVEFTWERPSIEGDSLRYDLVISKHPEFHDPILIKNLSEPTTQVWNLEIGERYYWKVAARRNTQMLASSTVSEFSTHPQAPRWLYIPGITNVRDVGGWPVPGGKKIRQGMIYRSSEMNSHLELTAQGKDILLNHLKISTDIDLRGEEEVRKPALKNVRYINAPIQPYANILEKQYQPFYQQIFKVLTDPSAYPIIVHCWGGADRTGTVFYLLEALLGVEKQWLVLDYELTSLSIWGERKHTSEEFSAFLESLSLFGENEQEQAENYLKSIGVTTDDISAIRKTLILTD
jgi:protein-tyrosine phosphatase